MSSSPSAGSLCWQDLTVENATAIRDFYAAVTGWTPEPHDMGDYQDFVMNNAAGEGVAGICHARGINANVPPQWLIYIKVDDLDHCVAQCRERGGEVVDGPRDMGGHRFCVIRDPAGAVAALIT